jgi:hypothetical protein
MGSSLRYRIPGQLCGVDVSVMLIMAFAEGKRELYIHRNVLQAAVDVRTPAE